MSNEIDWSKAPEGATHYDPLDNNWLRQVVGKALVWCGGGTGWGEKTWQYNNDLSTIRRLIVRALPWSGEGLPPVGTVCEVQKSAGWEWTRTTVLAHHLGFAVHSWSQDGDDMEVAAAPPGDFRPIRIAEQIAAEERDAECEVMLEIARTHRADPDVFDTIGALYDAGYRKVSAK